MKKGKEVRTCRTKRSASAAAAAAKSWSAGKTVCRVVFILLWDFSMTDFDCKNIKWHQINDVFALHHLDIYSWQATAAIITTSSHIHEPDYGSHHCFLLHRNHKCSINIQKRERKGENEWKKSKGKTTTQEMCSWMQPIYNDK